MTKITLREVYFSDIIPEDAILTIEVSDDGMHEYVVADEVCGDTKPYFLHSYMDYVVTSMVVCNKGTYYSVYISATKEK